MVAISRAAAVSDEIGRIARPATATPASAAMIVPPITPSARKSHSLLSVASSEVRLRAYWTYCVGAGSDSGVESDGSETTS